LSLDRAESNDLASRSPFVVQELEKAWLERLEEFRKLALVDPREETKPRKAK
jgi:hypothetical protein